MLTRWRRKGIFEKSLRAVVVIVADAVVLFAIATDGVADIDDVGSGAGAVDPRRKKWNFGF